MEKNKLALLVTVAAAIGTSAIVYSAGPGEPGRVIPYRGFLEQDGSPVNGPIDITFRLFDDVDTTSSQLSFTEVHDDVLVSNGNFAVLLGSITTLPEDAFVAAELHLQVEVAGTVLPGLQQIFAAPQAVRSSTAQDFTVRGTVEVDGQISVNAGAAPSFSIEASGDSGLNGDSNIGVSSGNSYLYMNVGTGNPSIRLPEAAALEILSEDVVGNSTGIRAFMQPNGSLELAGTVRWKCPSGMSAMGARCIDDTARGPSNYTDAINTCNNQGSELCTMKDYLTCDIVNHQNAVTNSCGERTDAPGSSARLWANETVVVDSSVDIFDRLSTYRSDNRMFFDNSGAVLQFFCCMPVVPSALPDLP